MIGSYPKKPSRFEDEEWFPEQCTHREHYPPGHIYVPAGKRYVHICPGCGHETILHSSSVRYGQ